MDTKYEFLVELYLFLVFHLVVFIAISTSVSLANFS